MPRRKKTRTRSAPARRQLTYWAGAVVAAVLAVMQQQGKPPSETFSSDQFNDVSVASVYDGDTFKINLNCSLAVYCEKVPVRVLGVDCPEIKGKTEKEKQLAQKAKAFTKRFLEQGPISLENCGRDKYFRLLCSVKNANGQNLADELIKHNLGYRYYGGKKSNKYQ